MMLRGFNCAQQIVQRRLVLCPQLVLYQRLRGLGFASLKIGKSEVVSYVKTVCIRSWVDGVRILKARNGLMDLVQFQIKPAVLDILL